MEQTNALDNLSFSPSVSHRVSLLKYHLEVVNKVFRASIQLVVCHLVRRTVPFE